MRLFRGIFFVLCMIGGGILGGSTIPAGLHAAYTRLNPGAISPPDFTTPLPTAAAVVFGAIIVGLLGMMGFSLFDKASTRWRVMDQSQRVTVFVAILVGVGISIPFHMLTFNFGPLAVGGSMLLMVVLVMLSYSTLKSMEDNLPWMRGAGVRKSNIKIFDTNVIIDGRIYDVAKSGFLEGKIYIPDFVLKELQMVADSHEPTRRQRGRRGLDLLQNLRSNFEIEVGTHDKHAGDEKEPVDSRLVKLAKATGACLVTNDYNLNKVAAVQGVSVLNVNDLAMAMRPQFLPMDTITVQVEREGSQPGQGVGFLDDGTMIVIEDGADSLGERIEVKVSQIHQSAAGRMIFATHNCDNDVDADRKNNKT